VCNNGSNTVSVFDATNPFEFPQTVLVGNGPSAIAVAADRYVCVTNATDGTVSIFDVTHLSTPATTVTVIPNPGSIAIADNRYVCVATVGGKIAIASNSVSVFDLYNPPNGPAPTVTVGALPVAIAIADNKYACVCCAQSNTVSIFDVTNLPSGTAPSIVVGGFPNAIAILPGKVFPPRQFTGHIHRHGRKSVLRMKWEKSPSVNIASYEIFAFRKRIATIFPHSSFKFRKTLHSPYLLRKRIPKQYLHHLHEKYRIRAVNVNGVTSRLMPLKVGH
jgi:hypothetical protein